MNKFAIAILLATLASSAFAQGKTRAEVYQELIEAQQNGLNYVTDNSYPDINPIYATVVAQMQKERMAQQDAAKQHMAQQSAEKATSENN
ncbi:DUF4148 domain-containing protein [Burkholderia sp. L27(2015)]|uniref:DUF4148 domain-containing protein n=1 Tax=Burkholderia sp. L27(2015) TaxID=1641858 RepID=UPI001575CB47|nr:DUF4148 domain-containing protein [Burkholderia sp. L27(2015)]